MVSRTWLAPAILIKQANYISEQLCKRFPDDATSFKTNLADLEKKLVSITPQSLPDPAPTVLAATPELKFLTRAVHVEDLHFNWNEKTNLAEAETNLADQPAAETTKYILFPQRLKLLADQLKPALQKRDLTPVFIDMLDRKDSERDFAERLTSNFKKMQQLATP